MHSWVRAFGVLAASTVLALSCTDANNPFGPDQRFQVQLAPRYAETAVSIASEPITEIRLTVKNASTGAVVQVETRVASEVETPDGSAWEVELEVTPPSDGSDVTILVELLNAAGETEWSGETGPIAVSSGSSSVVEDVEIFPGPPANLSVEAVEITTAPATLLEGDTSRLAASLTGGEEGARVVWSSITADLASVDGDGLATALLPGVARIQAAAGPAADTVEIEVLARPDSVLVTPATAVLGTIGAQVQLQAAVVDARGDTLAGEAVTWRVADPAVVSDLGGGLFEAISTGQTEATVLVASDTTVRTVVPLTVAVPNLVAARASVTTTLPSDTVVEGDSMTVDLAIHNEGTAEAGATTYALQVLDPADLTVVDDTMVALNSLAAGDSLVASHTFDTDSLSHWPDSVRFRMVVDDGGLVVESDETDNTITTGVFQLRRAVGSVVVSPSLTTLTRVGDTIRFTAEVLATDGSPLTGRTVTWSSSNTAVATVDGSGLATAVDFGSALISATSEGVSGTGELVVESTVPAGFTRQWLGGDPAGPTTWSVAGNWDPIGVPTLADTILIPSAAANQPVLDVDGSVGGLTVEAGATLDLASFTLMVDGSVSAGQTIVGTGTLVMSGAGTTLSGTVPSVTVTGDVSLSGTTGSTGVVHVSGADAALRVGAQTLTVSDSLLTSSSGVLVMTDGAGVVQVANGARFGGGDTRTTLTAGTLHVGGSFTQASGGSIYAFSASGTHTTLLDGSVAQTVSFASPTTSHFNVLEVTNTTSPVTLATQTEAVGDFALRSGGVIPSGDLRVAGGVLTETSTSLTLARLDVGGVMSVGDAYSVGTTRYTGSAQTVQAGLPYQVLEVSGDAALAGATDASGVVRIDGPGATLTVSGRTLTADSLHVDNQGLLVMASAADTVRIAGGTYFGGRVSTGWLTAGQLEVGGSFTQAVVTDDTSFDAGGTHRTVLDGTAAQTVAFGSGSSGFHHLRVENTVGVDFPTPALLSDDFVLGPSAVVSSGDVRAAGGVTTDATSSLTLNPLHVGGVMNVQGTYDVLTTRYTGTGGQLVQPGLPYGALEIWGDVALGGAVTTSGPVTVSGVGVNLDVNGQTLTVGDSLVVTAQGLLTMINGADVVDVANGARFEGGDTQATLTAGTLRVAGPFTQANAGTPSSFAASGTHTTILDGTALQAVSFTDPTASHFHHLQITNTSVGGVSISGTATAAGDFTLAASAVLDAAAGTLVTGGQVLSEASSNLTLQALELVDDTMSIGGSYSVGTTVFAEAPDALSPQILQSGLAYQDVTVNSVARYPGSSSEIIAGNLTVSGTGALFNPGTCVQVTVQGNLVTEFGGVIQIAPDLFLDCVAESLTVDGNATFGGGSTEGLITGSTLTVGGHFTETATDAFRASGSHTTVLSGTGTVTFADTQPSQFRNLTISGTITVPETGWVAGNLSLTGSGSATGAGALRATGNVTTGATTTLGVNLVSVGGTLDVQGAFSVTTTIFTGGTLEVRQEIQPDLPYENVVVLGRAQFPDFVGSDQTISSNLTIEGTGDFRPGACDHLLVGDLHTQFDGTLTMGDGQCPDRITVGNAIFGGGDTSGTLTGGVLLVEGDFIQTGANSATSFAPSTSGSHQVVLTGIDVQMISFDDPASHFHDLEILNTAGPITLESDVHVTGTLTEGTGGNPTIVSLGHLLQMEDASIDGLTFDNVLVELITPVNVRPLNNVTFSANYSTSATQLYVEGPNTTFTFDALTFNTEPTGGGFYLHAHDTLFDEQVFTIDVLNSNPDAGFPYINTTGADPNEEAIVNWSPPIL